MSTTPTTEPIGTPLLVAMAAVTASQELAVGKDGYNEHFGFNYMTEPAVFTASRAVLAAQGLSATITFEDGRYEIIPTFNKDGQERPGILATVTAKLIIRDQNGLAIECSAYGQGLDPGDKAMAKAMTMAAKYVCAKALLIPVESGDDTDRGEGHAVAGRSRGNGDGGGAASDKQLGFLVSLVRKLHLVPSGSDAIAAEGVAWRLARMSLDPASVFAGISKRTASDLIERLKSVEDNPRAADTILERLVAWETDNGHDSPAAGQPDEPVDAVGPVRDDDTPF